MSFSVGILYSAQEFISYVDENKVGADEFTKTVKKFVIANPDEILKLSIRCEWISIDTNGDFLATVKGKDLLLQGSPENKLRFQIRDIIFVDQPSWAAKIPNGRREAARFFPDIVSQAFNEAGLLKEWDNDLIGWWDELAFAFRQNKQKYLNETGRMAERLSIAYEEKRTDCAPSWQSLESNFLGYDILSCRNKSDSSNIKIEVKGSNLSQKEATFSVSKNEWQTAETSLDYRFHLWLLKGEAPRLFDVAASEVKKHIPLDQEEGNWQNVRIPFKVFEDFQVKYDCTP